MARNQIVTPKRVNRFVRESNGPFHPGLVGIKALYEISAATSCDLLIPGRGESDFGSRRSLASGWLPRVFPSVCVGGVKQNL